VDGGKMFLLGSGTEDHFSASFDGMATTHSSDSSNAGRYMYPYAGMPHHSPYPDDAMPSAPHERSAYRIFVPDPIIYTEGIMFLWRNGDTVAKSGGGKCGIGENDCVQLPPHGTCKMVGDVGPANVTTMAYLYEW
jgi:hypothetical protein